MSRRAVRALRVLAFTTAFWLLWWVHNHSPLAAALAVALWAEWLQGRLDRLGRWAGRV